MSSSEIIIVKRDGKREAFSIEKIKNAIRKAFLAVGGFATEDDLTVILARVRISNGMTVEEIQNQVEVALMAERYFAVAKCYMLYRQSHTEDRETRDRLDFLVNYCKAENAATGSKYDANANVEKKNIATLIGELPKQSFIRLNRRLLTDRLKEMYGKELSDRYMRLLNSHFIYKNDETSLANYCASITMYPWLLNGTIPIGGNSTPPSNLKSFCGGFINLVFIVSSMLSGACATPEFLMYMDYFVRKEYGEDYYSDVDRVVDLSAKQRSIDKVITDCFEQVVYSINQPTGARNFQAVFWNVAYYDRYYFESLFGEFRFPDGTKPTWESLSWLQKRFMKWFNAERLKTPLTFPVETMALLTKDNDVRDKEWGDFIAQMYAEGHSFFTYMSDNADSLSSCCRLRNEIQDNGFSYTLGAGGVSTGSKSVLTVNLNRCIQYARKNGRDYMDFLSEIVELTHKVQLAYNENLKSCKAKACLPLFDRRLHQHEPPIPHYRRERTRRGCRVPGHTHQRQSRLREICAERAEHRRTLQQEIPLERAALQLRDDTCRERGREACEVGQGRRLRRSPRVLQQLFLYRRRPVAQCHRQVPPPRTPLYRTPDGRLGSSPQPRRAPQRSAVPPAVARGSHRRMQLLHVQHPEHHLQRLRPYRQALSQGVPALP
jgi:anaerobic ribonucleoside-triphosphate reductase